MAVKGKNSRVDLRSARREVAELQARCAQLEEQVRSLKEQREEAEELALEPSVSEMQLREQVEHLLMEKSSLVKEKGELKRENEQLRLMLSFYKHDRPTSENGTGTHFPGTAPQDPPALCTIPGLPAFESSSSCSDLLLASRDSSSCTPTLAPLMPVTSNPSSAGSTEGDGEEATGMDVTFRMAADGFGHARKSLLDTLHQDADGAESKLSAGSIGTTISGEDMPYLRFSPAGTAP